MSEVPKEAAPTPRHSRVGLFAPFGIALLALAMWSVWWAVLIERVESGLNDRIATLREAGWTVTYGAQQVNGWPFRASVRLRDGANSRHSTFLCQMWELAEAPVVNTSAACTLAEAAAGGTPNASSTDAEMTP